MEYPAFVQRLLELGIGRVAVSCLARLEAGGPRLEACPRCGCALDAKKWSRACPVCRFELGLVR